MYGAAANSTETPYEVGPSIEMPQNLSLNPLTRTKGKELQAQTSGQTTPNLRCVFG